MAGDAFQWISKENTKDTTKGDKQGRVENRLT